MNMGMFSMAHENVVELEQDYQKRGQKPQMHPEQADENESSVSDESEEDEEAKSIEEVKMNYRTTPNDFSIKK